MSDHLTPEELFEFIDQAAVQARRDITSCCFTPACSDQNRFSAL